MIKVTADSTCDLSPEILKRWDISLAPLYVLVDNQSYRDGVDIAPADIFRHAEAGRRVRTAAVNQYDYERLFKRFSRDHEAVIHVSISQEFSACFNNARLAAQSFPNVHVVDSRNLSSGSGHVAADAAEMAGRGMQTEEIIKRLQQIVPRVDASFVIESLEHLWRSGRCSGLESTGARLLQIKPCIEVVNGEMKVGKKYRGSFEHCLEHYVRDRLEGCPDIDFSRVFITHSACQPELVGRVRELVRSLAPFEEIVETNAGCTVSNHCGPDTLGILFKRTRPKTGVEVR
jgi:DegV family protein with EDD domain